ncbi:mitochondrial proton/calcium exchanger protein-like protein isoform X1 [Tanacetum coccineum]
MSESAKRHEENSNLVKEIRASMDATIRNQGASIKTLHIQIGQMSKVLQERGVRSLPSSIKTNPRDPVKSISTIVEADSYSIRPYSEASHIHNSIPRKEKDPGSFTLPCFINKACFDNTLADLGASVSVMPLSTYLNLGLGELAHTKLTVELADRTVKYPKGIAENMLVGIGKFVFPVGFINLDIPEDIKVPLILGRPFLSTARAKIDVFKRKITLRVGEEKIIFKSVKPASSLINRVYMLGLRERIELDLKARLMGETLVLNRSLDPSFGDYIKLNDFNVPLELRRDQVDDLMPTIEEGEVVKEFRARNDARMVSKVFGYPSNCDHDKKIHIDCAYNLKFSCMIDFAVLEDMDAYHDEGMGDVIFGELFLREVRIKAKRFEGMITIYNGNEEVTYQMVRSHPRFKHHTNEQCNKIPPLLKAREEDKMNEISHSTSLKEKKSTMLVENIRSGNFEWVSDNELEAPEVAPRSPAQAPPFLDYVPSLEHPPSPDYVPSPEKPEQAPLSSDYVPEPEYPEYLVASDAEAPNEDQPLPDDASPTTLSPGYVADSDPEEDSKEDPTDYPADEGDDDDDESSNDDDDDDNEEQEASKDDDEEEEHPALADSSVVPVDDPVPLVEDTEAFETDESAHTPALIAAVADALPSSPSPSPLTPLSSLLPQIPSPPLPLLSPPTHTSRIYAEEPPGYRVAGIWLRAASPPTHHPSEIPSLPLLLPSTTHRDDLLEANMPLQKRDCFTTPTGRFEVRESSSAAAARQGGQTLAHKVDYGFINSMDASIRAAESRAMTP